MDNGIVGILRDMRDTYGEDIFYHSARAKNLLSDLCPKMQQERIQAVNFIELNGYFMLKYAGGAYPIVHSKLIATYMNTYHVNEQTAKWIVDVFAVLLGYIHESALTPQKGKRRPTTTTLSQNSPAESHAGEVLRKQVSSILQDYKQQAKRHDAQVVKSPGAPPPKAAKTKAARSGKAAVLSTALDHNHCHIAAGDYHTVAIKKDGDVIAAGYNKAGQCDVWNWHDIVSVSAGAGFTVGLRSNGTVVAAGRNDVWQCNVGSWTDIIAISAGARHTLGLRRDGIILATGENRYGECNVSGWRNITAIFCGNQCTYGIKKDRKVLARGYNKNMDYDTSMLSNIICIADANPHGALALRADGTVVKARQLMKGNFDKLHSLNAIVSTPDCFIGLRKNGTVRVLAYYWESSGVECSTDSWDDVCEIAAGRYHVIGLRRNGTLLAAMLHTGPSLARGQCDVALWQDLRV